MGANANVVRPVGPGFVAVLFDIPFPTSIPNGCYLTFDPQKGIACVEITLREGSRAFFRNRPIVGPTSFRDLQVAGGNQARPRENRDYVVVSRLHDGREKATLNVRSGVEGGYAECKYFSEVCVTFLTDDLGMVGVESSVMNRACEILNPFLDKYRLMSEDYRISKVSVERNFYFGTCHTSPLTPEEAALGVPELFQTLERGRTFLTELGRGAANTLRTNSYELLGPRSALEEVALRVFCAFIKDDYQQPLSYELLLEALSCLQKTREYRLGIVHAETAFEVYVVDSLIKLMVDSGTPRNDAERTMDADNNYWGVKRKVRQLDNWTQLYCMRSELPFAPFVNSANYTRWENDLYSKRNDAVHAGAAAFTYQEAWSAIEIAKQCIVFLEGRVPTLSDRVQLNPSMAGFRQNAGEVAF